MDGFSILVMVIPKFTLPFVLNNVLFINLHLLFKMVITMFIYSKRVSGFDMAPPPSALLPGAPGLPGT